MTQTQTAETQTAGSETTAEELREVHPDDVAEAGRAAAGAVRALAELIDGAKLEAQFAALDAMLGDAGLMAALATLVKAASPNLPAYDDLSTERAALALEDAGQGVAEARDEVEHALTLLTPLVG